RARTAYAAHELEQAAAEIRVALTESPRSTDVLTLAGDIFLGLEQMEKALEYYKRAYDIDGDKDVSARKYARALSEADRHVEAITVARKTVKNNRNDVYNQLTLGEVLVNADSLNAAELILTKAREMNRTIPDGFLALGSLYYRQRIYESARDNYEQAIKIDSTNEVALERLATMYFRMANSEMDNALAAELYTRSLQQWASVIRINPRNARAYYEQGKIFFYAQKFQSAAPSLAQYLRLRPDADNVPLAHWFLAQSYARFQACDSAEPHFRYAIEKIDSVRSRASLLFARCLFDTKKYAPAAEQFGSALKLIGSLDADDRERFGYSLILSGDTTGALEQLRTAIVMNPTKCKTMERLANLYYDKKSYGEAVNLYRQMMNSCPSSPQPRLNALIGRCYFSANQPDSAIGFVQAAVAADSSLFFARSIGVRSLATAGRLDEAVEWYLSALDFAKRDAAKYKGDIAGMAQALCGAYIEKKDFKSLQKYSRMWVEFDPLSEVGNLYLAVSYQGLGEKDGACKYYNEVLKINPNNKVAKDNKKLVGC
ncbi:MAG: tetratricopeptide repeat protein, partial [Candidatus Kapaibacterium sp.]